jgi:short subunit dehydrogenase-like uncharacterized protein
MDVVPSDCLSLKLKEKMKDAENLEISFSSSGTSGISRGTLKTLLIALFSGKGFLKRVNGKIVSQKPTSKSVIINEKKHTFVNCSWGDGKNKIKSLVSSAYYSTRINNIAVYMKQNYTFILFFYYFLIYIFYCLPFLSPIFVGLVDKYFDGTDIETTGKARVFFNGKVSNKKGETIECSFSIPEGYRFTADSTVKILQKMLNNIDSEKFGFLTPSLAFGENFIDECDGVSKIEFK